MLKSVISELQKESQKQKCGSYSSNLARIRQICRLVETNGRNSNFQNRVRKILKQDDTVALVSLIEAERACFEWSALFGLTYANMGLR